METTRTNKFNKIIFSVFCAFLALVMGLVAPLQVYAESTNVKYLCDLKFYYAENVEEAKSGLEKEGYTFLNNNLNNGTKRDKGVWLGYKTTTNPDMAITDIRMLGMDSGFQLFDYKQAIEYLKKSQSGTAFAMLEAANTFAQNYNDDSPKAISAYKGLNLFYVDEADMKLGDYIRAGKADVDFFMKMLLKSSAAANNAVIGFLNAGVAPYENDVDEETGETISSNWAQQLPQSSVFDVMESNPTADQIKEIKQQYNDDAAAVFKQIQYFVTKYENAIARNPKAEVDSDVSTYEEAVEETEEVNEEDADVVYINAFNKLEEYQYTEDYSLGEWILDIGHLTADEVDLTELYPLVDVMGAAQNDLINVAGFIVAISNLGENTAINEFEEVIPQITEKIKEYNNKDCISLWDNADDDIENAKIAFTSEAIRRQTANNLLVKSEEPNQFEEVFEIVMKWISIAIGILSVVVFVAAKVITAVAMAASSAALVSFLATALTVLGYAGSICIWAAVIVAAVTLVVMLVLWIKSLVEDEDDPVEYLQIPSYVIDATEDSNGDTLTVKYKVVTCNEKYDDTDGYLGDINARQENRWNAMCYTLSRQVGSPIRMDDEDNIFKVVEGDSVAPNGYAPMRAFGERAAVNCNSFCKKDSVGGIYMFYRTERSINNEAPETDESTPDEKEAPNGYLATLYVATEGTETKAKAKITKQSTKYYVFDRNLSPDAGYATYLGYTITMDPKQAITDIRIAPYNGNNTVTYGDVTYYFGGTVGVNMGSGEANASSKTDALMFTTDEKAGSPIGVDTFHVVNSPNDAEPGWEPVSPFANGLPYDFNVTHLSVGNIRDISGYLITPTDRSAVNWTSFWNNHRDIYLYFEPTQQYKSGEKYLSGIFFISGYDGYNVEWVGENKTTGTLKTSFSALKEKMQSYDTTSVVNVNLSQSITKQTVVCERDLQTYLCYTYTYNPKRAVYDLALFQGTAYSTSLPYSISKLQEDNSSVNYIASTTYVQQGREAGNLYRAISNYNSFMNTMSNLLDSGDDDYVDYGTDYVENHQDNIEFGFSKFSHSTVGLFAAGYTESKKTPIRMCDLVITQKKYTAENNEGDLEVNLDSEKTLDGSSATGVFHSVTNIENPNTPSAFNFAYSDYFDGWDKDNVKLLGKGANLYVYQRGAARAKQKYISSITLGAYSREHYKNSVNASSNEDALKGIDHVSDMYAMAGAAAGCTDEVLMKNLALNQSNAWYNRKEEHGKQNKTPPENNNAAYVGVSRTDNSKEAITGALLLQNDAATTYKSIKIGRVEYYCDSIQTPLIVGGKRYYLYYTYNTGINAGRPIEDIDISSLPLVSGYAGVGVLKYGEEEITADSNMSSFLLLKFDGSIIGNAFYDKIYIGEGKTKNDALSNLVEQGCLDFIDIDLNDGAPGNSVYFGFRYGSQDDKAIAKKKSADEKEAERRMQWQEAICDIVVTQGEDYMPDGFIGKNHIYYKPVSDVNLNSGNIGDKIYMYYCNDYNSRRYNTVNYAGTYLPMDVYTPIKSFAFTRYDCVPYNKEYAEANEDNDLIAYEYVMCRNEKQSSDLNSGVVEMNAKNWTATGDNRINMFVSRYDKEISPAAEKAVNMKPSAEITGGYVGKETKIVDLKIKGQ